jgi:hypothetical protein
MATVKGESLPTVHASTKCNGKTMGKMMKKMHK